MRSVSWRSADIYRPIEQNVIFYDGPSRITGNRILGVATAQNGNRKIGHMLQLWIIPSISPIDAVKTGRDADVCGDCRLRGDGHGSGRVCYVEWWRAVENIHQSAQKPERTARMSLEEFLGEAAGLQLRIGAYGDPVAIPMETWQPLLNVAAGWTAYTHQWRKPELSDGYASWCMASVENDFDRSEAQSKGWRTFRVREENGPVDVNEIVCPYETHERKCASCSLCRGTSRGSKSIVVTVHGRTGVKNFPLLQIGRNE